MERRVLVVRAAVLDHMVAQLQRVADPREEIHDGFLGRLLGRKVWLGHDAHGSDPLGISGLCQL